MFSPLATQGAEGRSQAILPQLDIYLPRSIYPCMRETRSERSSTL